MDPLQSDRDNAATRIYRLVVAVAHNGLAEPGICGIDVAARGRLSAHTLEARVPRVLPIPGGFSNPILETGHSRWIAPGDRARAVLCRMLLGVDAAAVCGGSYEPAVDRDADGVRALGKSDADRRAEQPLDRAGPDWRGCVDVVAGAVSDDTVRFSVLLAVPFWYPVSLSAGFTHAFSSFNRAAARRNQCRSERRQARPARRNFFTMSSSSWRASSLRPVAFSASARK